MASNTFWKRLSAQHPSSEWSRPYRSARFEPLEERQLLAVAPELALIDDVTLYSGAPLHIALNGSDGDPGDTLTYTVTSVTGDLSDLSTFIPTGNRSAKITVTDGDTVNGEMILEFFEGRAPDVTARIIDLIEDDFYNGLTFHRVIDNFMIQGGDRGSVEPLPAVFDDYFHPDLQHTSDGVWSMAKSRDDTNNSQFFITDTATRHLDFNHSIFGFLTEGYDVLEAISAVDVDGDEPDTDVVMTSVEVIDSENGVLMLKAPEGYTGSGDVTVTVSDGTLTAQQTFHVTVAPDPHTGTTDSNPYLDAIADIRTAVGITAAFDLNGFDVEGDPAFFGAWGRKDYVLPINPDIDITLNTVTGEGTIGPMTQSGVYGILVGTNPFNNNPDSYNYMDSDPFQWGSSTRAAWDFQFVPFLVDPAAPATLELTLSVDPNSDGVVSRNNTPGNELRFRLTGLITGAEVTLYADEVEIGQGTATSDDLIILTDELTPLSDGVHEFTARQTLAGKELKIGNRNETVDLVSVLTAPLSVTVDTADPAFTSTPIIGAVQGVEYVYNADTNEEGSGLTYDLTEAPVGMVIDETTGRITWTPQPTQGPTEPVTIEATDAAGNTALQSFTIQVNDPPVLDPIGDVTVAEGSLVNFTATASDADTPLSFSLAPGAPSGATINPNTGEFSWTPSEAQGPGSYDITLRVSDSTGLTTSQEFTVTVTEVNEPPVLSPIATKTVDEGQRLRFNPTVTDPDLPANTLTYTLIGAPDGATIDPNTGRFDWTPGETQGGQTFTIGVRVTDSGGASDQVSFDVDVNEVDLPPVFSAISTQVAGPGETLSLVVRATDPDRDTDPNTPMNTIRYSLEPGAPEGATIDPDSGLLTWEVPSDASLETVEIGVRATEINGSQTGLSSVALVRVVPFSLQGTLLGSAINDILGGIGDSPIGSGDDSLFELIRNSVDGDGFEFQIFPEGSDNFEYINTIVNGGEEFGAQVGTFTNSAGYQRFGENGEMDDAVNPNLDPLLEPLLNPQTNRFNAPTPDVRDAALEGFFEADDEA